MQQYRLYRERMAAKKRIEWSLWHCNHGVVNMVGSQVTKGRLRILQQFTCGICKSNYTHANVADSDASGGKNGQKVDWMRWRCVHGNVNAVGDAVAEHGKTLSYRFDCAKCDKAFVEVSII